MGEIFFRSNKMKVSVIIVTYNPMVWIQKCLSSLVESSSNCEIIVVDNNSNDGSNDFIKRKYPEITLVENDKNLGFGKANNLGIEIAYLNNSDYYFLLNQDAWVEFKTLEELIEIHKIQPEFDLLSPIHLNGRGNELDYNFSTFISPIKCKGFVSDMILQKELKRVYEVFFVNAAGWLLTKKCIEKVGGFNASFYHYGEDLNYVERLHYHELKLGIVPKAKMYHDRQDRKVNDFLIKEEIIFERNIIRELSRPNFFKDKFYFFKMLMKRTLITLFSFESFQFGLLLKLYKVYFKIDFKRIKYNRKKSLIEGLNFLEL
ncbi:MAG: family 2 glycosyl transferase [Flavobacteriaceae bacterium]|nr:MAG: family 2 glycosyl transferase [Flavobacteriaceae bacterium]